VLTTGDTIPNESQHLATGCLRGYWQYWHEEICRLVTTQYLGSPEGAVARRLLFRRAEIALVRLADLVEPLPILTDIGVQRTATGTPELQLSALVIRRWEAARTTLPGPGLMR